MTAYYATTRFYQNDQEFLCSWDLNATKGVPKNWEIIEHLTEMLSKNDAETWNLDEDNEDEDYSLTLDLYGLSPKDFALELVLNEKESQDHLGVFWEISTKWDEVDPDNWEHPCNL